jgi:hypothetical protein
MTLLVTGVTGFVMSVLARRPRPVRESLPDYMDWLAAERAAVA